MTREDEAYATWLNLLGFRPAELPEVADDLHRMHDAAEASHTTKEEDHD